MPQTLEERLSSAQQRVTKLQLAFNALRTARDPKYHSRECPRYQKYMAGRITDAVQTGDSSYAHVLLHSLVGVYNHTPHFVRARLLAKFSGQFPELVKACLSGCSQTGKESK